jgi:hypothetical protein
MPSLRKLWKTGSSLVEIMVLDAAALSVFFPNGNDRDSINSKRPAGNKRSTDFAQDNIGRITRPDWGQEQLNRS